MKKIVLIGLFALSSIGLFSQVSRSRLKIPAYSWINRQVPIQQYLDSTFKSFWNIVDDGTPLINSTGWTTSGNAISTNTNFIGTTTNRSLRFVTNNVERFKIDSTGIFRFNGNAVNFASGGTVQYTGLSWLLAGNTLAGDSSQFIGSSNTVPLLFKVNGSQMLKIDKNGHFGMGIGTNTSNIGAAYMRWGGLYTGGSTATGLFMQGTIAGDVTTAMRMMLIQPSYTSTSASVGSYVGVSSAIPTIATNTLTSLTYVQAGGSPIATAVTGTVVGFTSAVTQQSGGATYFNYYASNNAPSYFGAGGVYGIATNTLVGPGIIGEYISSLIAVGSAVSLSNNTPANIASISLTAGDWDVSGNINFNETAATVTQRSGGINTTSATIPVDGSQVYSGNQTTTTSEINSTTIQRIRVGLNATTTVYLVANAVFSAGTVTGFGTLTARRVR